jgi:hypothetical protein
MRTPMKISAVVEKVRSIAARDWSEALFPLTPALSSRERENPRQSVGESETVGLSDGRASPLPPYEHPFATDLPTVLPLPFRRGEGRGEGHRR